MATFIVSNTADSGAGSLRDAIDQANASGGADVIEFTLAPGSTITLASDLPQIAGDVVINATRETGITVGGAGLYRVFWADSGSVEINDLTIADGLAKGGDGGDSRLAGGGGAGLGGGLFVNQGANVTLTGVTFSDNAASGGEGGKSVGPVAAGGGGGMDEDAPPTTNGPGGDGGGPAGGAGSTASAFDGGDGGDFSGGGGGYYPSGNNGGDGGFGGGGGAGGHDSGVGGDGGDGGFGGGAATAAAAWGGVHGSPGYGGGATWGSNGGGGAGLGGAVFVRQGGSLILADVTLADSNAVSGGFDGDGSHRASAEGAGLFLMGGGTLSYAVSSGQTATIASSIESDGTAMTLTKTGAGTLVLSAATDFDSFTVSDGVLESDAARLVGDVAIAAGGELVVAQATTATWAQDTSGLGELSKTESGLLIVTGTLGNTGGVTVSDGTLRVNGDISGSTTTVAGGATLQGTGTVASVSVLAGGTLAPGASPGVLSTGNVALVANATLEIELGGTAGGQFDQLDVTGTVDLGGATLDLVLFGGFTPVVGDSFTIVDNDGADAVVGTFAGLSEGDFVTLGALRYTVSYIGGTGNDVTLTVSGPPRSPPRPVPTSGGDGDDMAFLSPDNNGYAGGAGADLISGEGGDDTLQGNMGADSIYGGAGNDALFGGKDADVLEGGDGADNLFGDMGDDRLDGGWGGDVLQGGQGADQLDGNEGADILRGGQGADVIRGGAGDDWLSGDLGDDTLTGGPGADVFHIFAGGGTDIVTDFNAAESDRVYLLPGTSYTTSQVGADTVIDVGGGKLVLQNVQLASLQSGWIFGA